MQLVDIILIAVLVLLSALALRHLLKKRGSCCGDCASCRKDCSQRGDKN